MKSAVFEKKISNRTCEKGALGSSKNHGEGGDPIFSKDKRTPMEMLNSAIDLLVQRSANKKNESVKMKSMNLSILLNKLKILTSPNHVKSVENVEPNPMDPVPRVSATEKLSCGQKPNIHRKCSYKICS